jgi:hypothetical protein
MVLHCSSSCLDADRSRDEALLLQLSYCCWYGVLLLCGLDYRGYLGRIQVTRTPFPGNIVHCFSITIAIDPLENVLRPAASSDLDTKDHSPAPEPLVNNDEPLIDS